MDEKEVVDWIKNDVWHDMEIAARNILGPCPKCSGDPMLVEEKGIPWVECAVCGLRVGGGQRSSDLDFDNCVALWNKLVKNGGEQ